MITRTINVYMEDGRVFYYDITSDTSSEDQIAAKAREHAHEIVTKGYRHNNGNEVEVYGPHKIAKVKITGGPVPTSYPDNVRGT